MKVLSVVGARPQFVKAVPVSRRLRPAHEEVLVHTGQHYDPVLSDVFFEELPVPDPDYHLSVGSGPHARQTALVMERLDPVVAAESPDAVLVYGDTNSTLGAALVAAKRPPLLAHVEAGLRSGDPAMPEEVNRVLTDHCSDLLFAPTPRAVRALRGEGLSAGVHRTGDVMYDALLAVRDRVRERSTALADLGVDPGGYVLATVHRERNTDDPDRLAAVISGLSGAPLPVVFPAHPRTTAAMERFGIEPPAGVRVVEPRGYLDFLCLLDGAARVATDSGGVQKEAFLLGTPCVTLREETEWVETVACGWNVLAGADAARIREALARDPDPPPRPALYGDGNAADAVVGALAAAVEGDAVASGDGRGGGVTAIAGGDVSGEGAGGDVSREGAGGDVPGEGGTTGVRGNGPDGSAGAGAGADGPGKSTTKDGTGRSATDGAPDAGDEEGPATGAATTGDADDRAGPTPDGDPTAADAAGRPGPALDEDATMVDADAEPSTGETEPTTGEADGESTAGDAEDRDDRAGGEGGR